MKHLFSTLLLLVVLGLGCAQIDPIPERVFDPAQDSGCESFNSCYKTYVKVYLADVGGYENSAHRGQA